MSGDKLKITKAEIVALDEQLAKADARRKKLEKEAAAKRAQTRSEDLEASPIHTSCVPIITYV